MRPSLNSFRTVLFIGDLEFLLLHLLFTYMSPLHMTHLPRCRSSYFIAPCKTFDGHQGIPTLNLIVTPYTRSYFDSTFHRWRTYQDIQHGSKVWNVNLVPNCLKETFTDPRWSNLKHSVHQNKRWRVESTPSCFRRYLLYVYLPSQTQDYFDEINVLVHLPTQTGSPVSNGCGEDVVPLNFFKIGPFIVV